MVNLSLIVVWYKNGNKKNYILILGKISRLIKSYSIENLPGPESRILIEHINKIRSISYPPTNPFENLMIRIVHVINIVNNIADILVRIPKIKQNPPINSSNATRRANSGGIFMLTRNPVVPEMSCNLIILCVMKTIPTIILIGKGLNFE